MVYYDALITGLVWYRCKGAGDCLWFEAVKASWVEQSNSWFGVGRGGFPLNIWRHYLYAVHCMIYTYHNNLRYLMEQPNLNVRQHRWLVVEKDYHCEIVYHARKAKVVSMLLASRRLVLRSRMCIWGWWWFPHYWSRFMRLRLRLWKMSTRSASVWWVTCPLLIMIFRDY